MSLNSLNLTTELVSLSLNSFQMDTLLEQSSRKAPYLSSQSQQLQVIFATYLMKIGIFAQEKRLEFSLTTITSLIQQKEDES